jgi:hypothetical protein
LDVAWVLLVEQVVSPWTANREEAVDDLADVLDQSPVAAAEDRAMTRREREQAAAMYALAGGPARPREARPDGG